MRGRVPGNRGGQRAISCKDRTRLLPGRTHLHGCSDADGRASARPAAYRRPRSPRANALSVLCRCSSTATPPPFMQIASASPSRPHTSHHVPSLFLYRAAMEEVEAKVVVLGDSGVGKTCLVLRCAPPNCQAALPHAARGGRVPPLLLPLGLFPPLSAGVAGARADGPPRPCGRARRRAQVCGGQICAAWCLDNRRQLCESFASLRACASEMRMHRARCGKPGSPSPWVPRDVCDLSRADG